MMTIGEMIRRGAETLRASGIENHSGEARDIAIHFTGFSRAELFMHEKEEAGKSLIEDYERFIEKRSTHYPLQYLMGETFFMGYTFMCRENVLIPRYDTENLVEAAVKDAGDRPSMTVLDMCAGSGCIGLSFYLERLKSGVRDRVTLADISDDAIALENDNMKSFDEIVPGDIEIVKTDLFSGLVGKKYDVLMTNPPYIPSEVCDNLEPEVRDHEPRLALDGDADGLSFYRRIISDMKDYLNEGAYIYMEIGCDQYESVRELLVKEGYGHISLIKDLSGLDRVVSCRKVI